MATVTLPAGTTTWTVPAGVTSLTKVTAWGAGGGGGTRTTNGGGGGGGGGSVAITSDLAVTPGQTIYMSIPTGGTPGVTANPTWLNITGNATPADETVGVLANAGNSVASNIITGGTGPGTTGNIGLIFYNGGTGGTGSGSGGGGGGSSAGSAAAGVNASTTTGGTAPTGGGNGGNGATVSNTNGFNGSTPGGGGGGGYRVSSGTRLGGNGGDGQIIIEYTAVAAGRIFIIT